MTPHAQPAPPAELAQGESLRPRAITRVLLVVLGLNALVAAAKIAYGKGAHVLAIEADGYHSLTDALSSVVALIGLWLSARPPSARHPYGHRKNEVLAALVIGLAMLLLAAGLANDIALGLTEGRPIGPRVGPLAFVVLLSTLGVNLGVALFQGRRAARHRSALLATDARHTRSDCLVTLGVLFGTGLTWAGLTGLDIAVATVVAVLVGKAGVDVVRENLGYLTDQALVAPEAVARVVEGIAPVVAVGRVRTRGTPGAVFMDLRVSLPPYLSVASAGEVVALASETIRHEFPDVVDVVIHPEVARSAAA